MEEKEVLCQVPQKKGQAGNIIISLSDPDLSAAG